MEILLFRYNGDIILMVNKNSIKKDSLTAIASILQKKLQVDYQRDWNNIDFYDNTNVIINHPSYEWFGNNGSIKLVGEIYHIDDL